MIALKTILFALVLLCAGLTVSLLYILYRHPKLGTTTSAAVAQTEPEELQPGQNDGGSNFLQKGRYPGEILQQGEKDAVEGFRLDGRREVHLEIVMQGEK
ncbi:MAG: hypothetical protein ACOY81_05705 [Bacillota bacterium]